MKKPISIVWFRQDLRLADNPALAEAARLGDILPIYILDDLSPSPFKMGGASQVYLHDALQYLNQSLNNHLNLYIGRPEKIIIDLVEQYAPQHIFWNRCYEPWQLEHDVIVKNKLDHLNINYVVFNGSYLFPPETIKKEGGGYYKVFGAYKRKVYTITPSASLPKPKQLTFLKDHQNKVTLPHLKLTSNFPWQNKIKQHWRVGESEARNRLNEFLVDKTHGLFRYQENRDYPALNQTSRLSASLHFGEISPHQIWHAVNQVGFFNASQNDANHFLSELVWREFSAYLLYHFKNLATDNFQSKFNIFPWQNNNNLLDAWKKGNTGYPLIDAGMRELWQTGYMHNRVRMVVASFLVKNLMIHWHYGRDWFWDCLVDADLANNSASWQWVAGCGVDAAPYFRIFNPTTQGEKFDKEGHYTKQFIPALKNLPTQYLFKPWEAPENLLKQAGIVLGVDYPKPIVDLKTSRERALSMLKHLK